MLATEPDLLLDNGGDLFARYLEAPYDGLLGGTEETTSGRDRLLPLRDRIAKPLLVINDSPIKQFAENTHAVGPSMVESFMRITNRITNGRRVDGVRLRLGRPRRRDVLPQLLRARLGRRAEPVLQLERVLDGFDVPDREAALAERRRDRHRHRRARA